ncbi:phage tail protein I [Utexia brackfieldae]|uniref:phage tail protein I n=1 Tax=Utexia brackfieldae TaxID=3074108 RepID=UPI00370D0715
MSNKTLLPPTATKLEKNLANTCQIQLNVDLRFLWDPLRCPAKFLPFLAWQYSVDRWDENWPQQIKRKVIVDSYLTHKFKGTISAIKKAVEPFGYVIRVKEWFHTGQEPGTFSLEIGILNTGITEDDYRELTRIIDDVRAYSRHITGLSIVIATQGQMYNHAITLDGNAVTVYPYVPESISISGRSYYHAISYFIDTIEVNP